jgi:hypothetical protein
MRNISIVVEFENATLHGLEELMELGAELKRQVLSTSDIGKLELLCAYPGGDISPELSSLRATVAAIRNEMAGLMDVRLLELPNRRYYELKNDAARQATNDILVFLDSDIIVQPGWLRELLEPFDDPDTQISLGLTSFLPENFLSRTFALVWFFPIQKDDPETLQKRALVANNIAFRRDWFLQNPYPENDGFKVSCTIHAKKVEKQGIKVARPPAIGLHRFWADGLDFLLWRALVAGRDADRKLTAGRPVGRRRRIRAALSHWRNRMISKPRRIICDRAKVDLPLYHVPAAIGVAWAFYTLTMLSQLGFALGIPKNRVEHLPERFHIH